MKLGGTRRLDDRVARLDLRECCSDINLPPPQLLLLLHLTVRGAKVVAGGKPLEAMTRARF